MSVFNASRLQNKTVLITGASGGIGEATAILFAKAGSNVILAARRTEVLAKVKAACETAYKESGIQTGGKFAAIKLDVSDKNAVANLWNDVPQELRDVDILVNNAGFVLGVERVGDINPNDIEAMFATNVLGLISVTQALIKDFKERKKGHFINIGSVAGREPYVGGSIYCATKHAVSAFTGSLMRELVDTPIRVTEIQPGMVETDFSVTRYRGDKTAADKVYAGLQPLVAEDIAEEIVWAAARPPHVNLAQVYVLPVNQASATLNYRATQSEAIIRIKGRSIAFSATHVTVIFLNTLLLRRTGATCKQGKPLVHVTVTVPLHTTLSLYHVNMGIDLRLGDFIPGLLVPPEANIHLTIGIHFLLAALYTLTITSHPRAFTLVRIVLGIPAGYIFYLYAFYPYETPTRGVDIGLAVVGLYGIMRVIDTCIVDLLVGVHTPPRWVVDGKVLPLPTSFFGRLGYSIDYLLSLRGTSIFKNTTWDWIVPSTKRRMPSPKTSRLVFLASASWSLFKQYLIYDALDTLNKSRIWDNRLPHPITDGGLNIFEQLTFAFSVCAGTALSISFPATMVAIFAVACGAPVEAWPPMFDAPFSAVSLADFWTRRWHSLFRRVFDRLSLGIIHGLEKIHAPLPSHLRKTLRAILIFALSATLHLFLMYRLPISDTHHHPSFLDRSTLFFFLSQPFALLVEKTVIEPLSGGNIWVTRCWAWGWLLCSGRWWADVWVRRGLWDPKEKVVGYSVARRLLKGTWSP
ncbi:short chain dehydrogenase [Rhizoctonia solani]|uniref:Short chain dehydrogenase n=1 Tax=Rhizoctonia solani TaxID=456999 RepID=A0A8H8T0A7_9AGAM|nr:short chain dehydrogenase [Rhizoctonia solani]QRW25196.1 short chain dehydrogenase [Rhizoctonia solani]